MHRLQRLTWLVERIIERTTENMLPTLKNNTTAGYQPEGPLKKGLLKGAGFLNFRRGPGVAV